MIDRSDIATMYETIAPYVRKTPVIDVPGADFGAAGAWTLKLELLQHAGSFKPRGAFANLLTRDVPAAGVVAASGGNHGAAVAYAARQLGISAKIFVPTISSPAKIARIREYGADVVVTGDRYQDALDASVAWMDDTGAMSIHAFDQDETLLGQGTTGLELERQAPDLDTIVVAVGGGGFIGGIAAWYGSRVKIVGVEPQTSRALHAALDAGEPVRVDVSGVAADSLGAGSAGSLMFPIARDHVDHVALVTDEAICEAQELLWNRLRLVAEPGGAAALAALTSGAYRPAESERVGVLVCGGNTDVVNFSS
jgi:threonine dehydratase